MPTLTISGPAGAIQACELACARLGLACGGAGWTDEATFAEQDWTNQPGPRSKRRWVHTSGRVVYSDTNPGASKRGKKDAPAPAPAPKPDAAPARRPAAPPPSRPEAAPGAKKPDRITPERAQRMGDARRPEADVPDFDPAKLEATADSVHDFLHSLRPDNLTPEKVTRLAEVLAGAKGRAGMKVAELKALAAKLGVTAGGGKKSDMAQRIADAARKKAGAVGTGADQWASVMGQGPATAGAPGPEAAPEAHPVTAAHSERLANAFDAIDRETGRDNMVSLVRLGKDSGLSPTEMHNVLDGMRQSGEWTMTGAEGRHGISDEERKYGLHQGGSLLLYLSRKQKDGAPGKGAPSAAPAPVPVPVPVLDEPVAPPGPKPARKGKSARHPRGTNPAKR